MSESAFTIERLAVRVGAFTLSGIDFAVDAGECCVVLGPNGAGKSVLLETLAGFYQPSSGAIRVRGRDVTRLAPEHRSIALLFQDFALFPHLTVAQNIRFGLKRRTGATPDAARLEDLLRRFGLTRLRDRHPRHLSGGERQKVALARAMAVEPKVFLFDEPASALDARTRTGLQEGLKHFLRESGVPAVYVTHDHTETRALADRVLVLHEGRVMQSGPPDAVFNRPANAFVADFVGVETITGARILEIGADHVLLSVGALQLRAARPEAIEGREALICIRAENVSLRRRAPGPGAADNTFSASVVRVADRGPYIEVGLDAGFHLSAYVMKHSTSMLDLAPNACLWVYVPPDAVHVIMQA